MFGKKTTCLSVVLRPCLVREVKFLGPLSRFIRPILVEGVTGFFQE
jgi:hypothetical protein